ncbi:MAG: hypothetical protein QXW98_06755 [Candidatus Caldarchaeum sp.]
MKVELSQLSSISLSFGWPIHPTLLLDKKEVSYDLRCSYKKYDGIKPKEIYPVGYMLGYDSLSPDDNVYYWSPVFIILKNDLLHRSNIIV